VKILVKIQIGASVIFSEYIVVTVASFCGYTEWITLFVTRKKADRHLASILDELREAVPELHDCGAAKSLVEIAFALQIV
jgi:hypothetical protein